MWPGSSVTYVKPHGALYNTIVNNHDQARAVAEAVHAVDPGLPVLGLAGSVFFAEADRLGLRTVPEAFADRSYRPDGQLVSRRERNAVLHDAAEIADRVASMVQSGTRRRRRRVDRSRSPSNPFVYTVIHPERCRSPPRCATGWSATVSSWRRSSDATQAGPARPAELRTVFRRARGGSRRAADGDLGRRHHAAHRRRRVGGDDRRLLLAARVWPPVGLGRIAPSAPRIDGSLARMGVDRLEAVLPVHTHFDHAMDSAVVAERTGARFVGGESAAQVGVGGGLPEDRLVVAVAGRAASRLGAYDVTLVESEHCPPDRFPGVITEPVAPPVKASAYKCGEAWSTLVHHRPSDRRLLIVGSAGFVPGALAGYRADVVYLGVGQLGVQPEHYLVDYWAETVRAVGARRVVLIHWDDFFRPLTKPLRALPYAGDDLDVSMRVLTALARRRRRTAAPADAVAAR